MAMNRGLQEASYLRETLEEILNWSRRSLEWRVLTDGKSLYKAVEGNKSVGVERLRSPVNDLTKGRMVQGDQVIERRIRRELCLSTLLQSGQFW